MLHDQIPGFSLPAKLAELVLNFIGEHPFISKIQAKQLLFEGYRDRIFDMINLIKKGLVPDRMGLFYGKNSTNDGLYEIRSGTDDPYSVGDIVNWQNHSALFWTKWWRTNCPTCPQASMINGTGKCCFGRLVAVLHPECTFITRLVLSYLFRWYSLPSHSQAYW